MLLFSPDLTLDFKIAFSNGNCELLVAECSQLNASICVLYRPPMPNFSLAKFKEVMEMLKNYLKVLQEVNPSSKIILAGDFNFPPRVVEWIKTDDGIFADTQEGVTDEKEGFKILYDLANAVNLEQLVDAPTRDNNILDLVFSNCAEHFSDCRIKSISPVSDHNLVSFSLTEMRNIGQYRTGDSTSRRLNIQL